MGRKSRQTGGLAGWEASMDSFVAQGPEVTTVSTLVIVVPVVLVTTKR